MYQVSRETNRLVPIEIASFKKLGFRERQHVQEWIAALPEALGEDLLIIQKEFDGFDDTRERLDLLAIDKKGRLVIIENKLDDSGRDVTWQALKYAAYCSALKTHQVVQIAQSYFDSQEPGQHAAEVISNFLGVQNLDDIILNEGNSQRVIMLAANLRKEVTSTALWLISFGLSVQCFRMSPYARQDGEVFILLNQVIPVPEAEEFMIGIAEKEKEEGQIRTRKGAQKALQKEFWTNVLQALAENGVELLKGLSPREDYWLGRNLGLERTNFEILHRKGRIDIRAYINTGDYDRNKETFDALARRREAIDDLCPVPLIWDRKDASNPCEIYASFEQDIQDKDHWPSILDWICLVLPKFHEAFSAVVPAVKADLHQKVRED